MHRIGAAGGVVRTERIENPQEQLCRTFPQDRDLGVNRSRKEALVALADRRCDSQETCSCHHVNAARNSGLSKPKPARGLSSGSIPGSGSRIAVFAGHGRNVLLRLHRLCEAQEICSLHNADVRRNSGLPNLKPSRGLGGSFPGAGSRIAASPGHGRNVLLRLHRLCHAQETCSYHKQPKASRNRSAKCTVERTQNRRTLIHDVKVRHRRLDI